VTIAYVPPTWHKTVRGERIAAAWGFTCACARCAAPWDDTIVVRCRACANGRVFDGAARCAECGAEGDARLSAAARDEARMMAPIFSGGRPAELIQRILRHPILAAEDVRLFLAGADLLPRLAPAPALAAELARGLAAAAARMPWLRAEDHGIPAALVAAVAAAAGAAGAAPTASA
jgi:hypothetical protein